MANCESPPPTVSSPSSVGSESWRRPNETVIAVDAMLKQGAQPRDILSHILPDASLPVGMSNATILRLIAQIINEPPKREKLAEWNTFSDAVTLIRRSQRILVLTGAGVSVSCGIPDFRSKDGIYARLHRDFPDLPDPHAMFDIDYFRRNPHPFFDFAQELFPGQFRPSISHHFIKALEDAGKLLRNYTQNIDTLEHETGITRLVECHGSFATASCLICKRKVDHEEIKEDVLNKRVARCKLCTDSGAVMKPDIVFFGEDLPETFHERFTADRDQVDLLIVIGSSLKVRPVALIPSSVLPSVPQILINRESLPHYIPDIELLGNCDDIIRQLCHRLGEPFSALLGANGETAEPASSIDSAAFRRLLDEPDPKRTRTESPLWSGRYVIVGSRLPVKTYLELPPNRTVFDGAEFFFDRDEETFLSRIRNPSTLSSTTESQCSSGTDDEDRGLDPRGGSESPKTNTDLIFPSERPSSAPPHFIVRGEVSEL